MAGCSEIEDGNEGNDDGPKEKDQHDYPPDVDVSANGLSLLNCPTALCRFLDLPIHVVPARPVVIVLLYDQRQGLE